MSTSTASMFAHARHSTWLVPSPLNNERGSNQMAFDLSQYIPFNAFVFVWILGMLAFVAFSERNNKKGQ
jgi:hypothetical protein